MELRDPHRQAVRVGIVPAVGGHPLLAQLRAPRRKRQSLFESRFDVPERRLHRRAGRRRRWSAAEAENAGVIPDPGEIGHAIGGAWRRRGEIRLAVGSAGHVLRRIRRPLRNERR